MCTTCHRARCTARGRLAVHGRRCTHTATRAPPGSTHRHVSCVPHCVFRYWQALAAAIVDACKAGATTDPATPTPGNATASQPPQRSSSSRSGRGVLAAALGATAVLVAALAVCVAWVVFVLLDRGLVGPGAEQVASLGAGFGSYGGGGYMEG